MFAFTDSIKRNHSNSPSVVTRVYQEWLEEIKFSYFFTGTFRYPKSDAVIQSMVEGFIKRLNYDFYGRHRGKYSDSYSKQASTNYNRLELFWVIHDHLANGSHIHMLVKSPKGEMRPSAPQCVKAAFEKHWVKSGWGQNIDFQVIDKSKEDHTVGYLLKDLPMNLERIFINHLRKP